MGHVSPNCNGALGNRNVYLDQLITKAWCQPIGGHVSYPTDSPFATRLGLFSSLIPLVMWMIQSGTAVAKVVVLQLHSRRSTNIGHSTIRQFVTSIVLSHYMSHYWQSFVKWLLPSKQSAHDMVMRPKQNCWHFEDIFKCIYSKEKFHILNQILPHVIPKSIWQ